MVYAIMQLKLVCNMFRNLLGGCYVKLQKVMGLSLGVAWEFRFFMFIHVMVEVVQVHIVHKIQSCPPGVKIDKSKFLQSILTRMCKCFDSSSRSVLPVPLVCVCLWGTVKSVSWTCRKQLYKSSGRPNWFWHKRYIVLVSVGGLWCLTAPTKHPLHQHAFLWKIQKVLCLHLTFVITIRLLSYQNIYSVLYEKDRSVHAALIILNKTSPPLPGTLKLHYPANYCKQINQLKC